MKSQLDKYKLKMIKTMKNLMILIMLFSLFSFNTEAKQYNVSGYYKTRYIGDVECKEFYTYQNGKEILINVICIND